MPSKERQYTFYVEPLDSFTNESVARVVTDENVMYRMICEDSCEHDLWRFTNKTRDEFYRLIRTRLSDDRFKFVIWSQEGLGKIRKLSLKIVRRFSGKSKKAKVPVGDIPGVTRGFRGGTSSGK